MSPWIDYKRRRKLHAPGPRRTYIDQAVHIDALLSAAAELDREAPTEATTRYAILITLTFAGLRIGELLTLRREEVDLAARRLRVTAPKTNAGDRDVLLLPVLREELSTLKARHMPEPDAPVFGTTTGAPQNNSR